MLTKQSGRRSISGLFKISYFYFLILSLLLFQGFKSAFNPNFLIPTSPINIGDSFFPLVYPHMLFAEGFDLYPFLFSSFYLVLSSLIGFTANLKLNLLRNVKIEQQIGFSLLIGFAPGYLILTAVNRFISYILPSSSFQLIYTSLIFFTFAFYVYLANQNFNKFKMIKFKQVFYNFILSLILLIVFLVIQIQTNLYNGLPIHIIGDSAIFNSTYISQLAASANFQIDLFEQHYDEIIFLAPVAFIFRELVEPINAVDWLWIIYALMKSSVFVWIYFALNKIFKNYFRTLLVTLFLFFGNIFINPLTSPLINDSASNLAASSHSGRILITGLSIYLFTRVVAPSKNIWKISFSSIFILFFLSAGVASLTASVIYVFALGVASWIYVNSRNLNRDYIFYLVLSLVFIVLMNYLVDAKISLLVVLITSGFTLWSLDFAKLKNFVSNLDLKRLAPSVFVAIFGFLVPALLLGNLFSKSFRSFLGLDVSNYSGRDISAGFGGLGNNPYIFDQPIVMLHQQSLSTFFQYYGFPIFYLAIALILVISLKIKNLNESLSNVFFTSAFIILSFFLWNDLNGGNPDWMGIWVKSRLIEVTFYIWVVAILKLLYDIVKQLTFKTKIFDFVLIGYLVLSLLGPYPGGMLGQFFKNLTWFLAELQ